MSEQETPDYTKIIRKLSKAQRAAFDRICCGDDSGIAPSTGAALVRRGLVRSYDEREPGLSRWLRVTRYDFLLPAHIAWCAMMSEEAKASP